MKLLKFFEKIYHLLSYSKNVLYDKKILDTVKLPIPVVSIGNLSFGGVGKTPCIIMLAKEFSLEHQVTVITKSYKTSLNEAKKVDITLADAAKIFGDESFLIKAKLPQCAVWTGPIKSETTVKALQEKPSLLLIDDGFSHRKLMRNFDLVLVDATQGFDTYMRESKSNIKRAQAVLITKANLTNELSVKNIKEKIIKLSPQLKDQVYISEVKTFLNIDKNSPLFVFSGLARPDSLAKDLKKQGFAILHHEKFSDHYMYTELDQKKIFAKYLDLKNQNRNLKLVTTEKDFVKLTHGDLLKNIVVTEHSLLMDELSKGKLIEKIRKSF